MHIGVAVVALDRSHPINQRICGDKADEEQLIIRELLESMIVKYEARRWTHTRIKAPAGYSAGAFIRFSKITI
ncbi:hypothetical protein P3339_16025 [Microbulbifer sp. MLAF003]|uniref:hypothetical protein n=1 Tax=Microbulbifer sp. MLAF003 TaxID=3032582 RepID=UPI0024ADE5FB|nr:hypothetical protein [Microbulbifer sp. MLAF003]WHI49951.1 hypothetical protein P3339_16025 [Microbulbifer sp. MLAF003]